MSIGNANSPEEERPSTDDRSEDRTVEPSVEGPSIGTALKKARIAAGLTVDEVSSTTRVRIPIVHAIEEDDFTRCGGDVYARGHIRTLARAVHLDPAPLIDSYDAAHGGRLLRPRPPRRCSRPSGSGPNGSGPTGPRRWSPPSSP